MECGVHWFVKYKVNGNRRSFLPFVVRMTVLGVPRPLDNKMKLDWYRCEEDQVR